MFKFTHVLPELHYANCMGECTQHKSKFLMSRQNPQSITSTFAYILGDPPPASILFERGSASIASLSFTLVAW